MKSLFGGSAALATAFITAAVLFQASPSTAETTARLQEPTRKQEPKPDPQKNLSLPDSIALPPALQTAETAGTLAPDATASAPLKIKAITEEPPVMNKREEIAEVAPAAPVQIYVATAYSFPGRTASGRPVGKGLIAADTSMLPMGTRVRLEAGQYSGEYTVADRGSAVRGRRIDVWMPSTREACRFGRRPVKLTVLSFGARYKAKAKR